MSNIQKQNTRANLNQVVNHILVCPYDQIRVSVLLKERLERGGWVKLVHVYTLT